MATLKFPNQAPPGGWRYWQKESRLTIKADSLNALTAKVRSHRQYKGYEPTDATQVRLEIERQICSRLSVNECKSEGVGDEWVPIENPNSLLDLKKIWSFSKAAVDWAASGRPLVAEEEMRRRAAICADCPLNQPITGCASCGVMGLINQAIPKERRLGGLGGCISCGCSIVALVNAPDGTILTAHAGRKLTPPGWCWLNAVHEQADDA